MTVIEIFRNYRNFRVSDLTDAAGISKQTYYNHCSGYSINEETLSKIDQALNLDGFLLAAPMIDKLRSLGVRIEGEQLPPSYRHFYHIIAQHRELESNSPNILDGVLNVKGN